MLNNVTTLEALHFKEAGIAEEFTDSMSVEEAFQAVNEKRGASGLWSLREFMVRNPEKFEEKDYEKIVNLHKKREFLRFIPLAYELSQVQIPKEVEILLKKRH